MRFLRVNLKTLYLKFKNLFSKNISSLYCQTVKLCRVIDGFHTDTPFTLSEASITRQTEHNYVSIDQC